MKNTLFFLILFLGIKSAGFGQDNLPVDAFVSPEYMCLSKDHKQVYVGLSTYPGIAVYNIDKNKIEKVLPVSAPVSGIQLSQTKNLLYVGLRNESSSVELVDVESGQSKGSIQVGYYPEDLELSKRHNLLFTANRFGNSVSFVDLSSNKEVKQIKTGREPVALALSPDEDILAVAHLLPEQNAMAKYIAAKISIINVQSKQIIHEILLPNGSYALKDLIFSPDGAYVYVSHLIGRFNVLTNQIEKGWINTNAVSILDIGGKSYFTSFLLDDIYKGAANPNGLSITEDGKKLLVCTSGTHELFEIDRIRLHDRIGETRDNIHTAQAVEVSSPEDEKVKSFQKFSEIQQMNVRFGDLSKELGFIHTIRNRLPLPGKGPAKVITVNQTAFISSYYSDQLEVVNLESNTVPVQICTIGDKNPEESPARLGEVLFHDANNCFQQWQSCASCHPGDGRTDGLNWDLLNDGIGNPKNTKSLFLVHETPPAMHTGIRDDAETAVRAGFKYIQFFDIPEEDASKVDAYLKSLQAIPSPYLRSGKLSERALAGETIFKRLNCAHCHSGSHYTNLERYEIGSKGKYDKQRNWDTPSLKEVWRTAPYLHNGEYSDLIDIFTIAKHGINQEVDQSELENLVEYILSL